MTASFLPHKPLDKKSSDWGRWLMPALSLPIVVVGIILSSVGYRELRAEWKLRSRQLSSSSSHGLSGDRLLAETFRNSTSQSGTALWSQIFFLLSAPESQAVERLPLIGSEPLPPVIDPLVPWEAEERTAEYLQGKRVLIELIYQAGREPKPVWQPIAFEGVATLWPEIGAVSGVGLLLQLEAEYALYKGDSQRAMAALDGLHNVAQAFDWKLVAVTDMAYINIRRIYLSTVARSLNTRAWKDDQLERLSQQLKESDLIADRWQRITANEQTMAEATLAGQQEFFGGMRLFTYPSAQLKTWQHFAQLQHLPQVSNGQLPTRAKELEQRMFGVESARGGARVLTGRLMLAPQAYATTMEQVEQLRKLTSVAVELKRFHLRHDRWPEHLAELSSQGLTMDDWSIVGIGSFGYESEGDRAHVWGLSPAKVLSPMPPVASHDVEHELSYKVTISAAQQQP